MTISVQTENARKLSAWLKIEANNLFLDQTSIVASGQSVGGAIDLGVASLAMIITPAALTNGTMRFQVSDDGVTYYPLLDPSTNTRVTWTVATNAANAYWANPSIFWGIRFLKIDMSGAEGSARSFKILGRPS